MRRADQQPAKWREVGCQAKVLKHRQSRNTWAAGVGGNARMVSGRAIAAATPAVVAGTTAERMARPSTDCATAYATRSQGRHKRREALLLLAALHPAADRSNSLRSGARGVSRIAQSPSRHHHHHHHHHLHRQHHQSKERMCASWPVRLAPTQRSRADNPSPRGARSANDGQSTTASAGER